VLISGPQISKEMKQQQKRILVYRTGQLGDTLVALPAMRAIRNAYPDAELILLTDYHPGKGFVSSWDVLKATGLFSEVMFYIPPRRGPLDWIRFINLAARIRSRKPEALFYLRDPRRHHGRRDRFFFQTVCGIADCFGLDGSGREAFGSRGESGILARLSREGDRLLEMIGNAGVSVPRSGDEEFGLPISSVERSRVGALWLEENISNDTPVIAMCPGSKMAAKRWPLERFEQVGTELLNKAQEYRLMVFGGPEDQATGDEIRRSLGKRAINLTGRLSLLESAEALRRCVLYVGNDTGVMHLAAAVGTPCVAIFSARDHPGRWEPYGSNHVVLRREVPCAGCMLETCIEKDMLCLKEIGVDDVLNAVEMVLRASFKVQGRFGSANPSGMTCL
jgi:heptosyltransferase III